jgi:hypothetical protein
VDEKRLWAAVLIQPIKGLAGFTLVDNDHDRERLKRHPDADRTDARHKNHLNWPFSIDRQP